MRGRNFLLTMLRLARERDELRVVDDQAGTPTWSRMVAEGTVQILSRTTEGSRFVFSEPTWGTYHLAAAGCTTWCQFARAILSRDPRHDEQRCRSVVAVRSTDYPALAMRPRYSVLDSTRARERLGVWLPHWEHQLELALASS
jgi:dTDP-4-dehydrorhamnose reductase